MALLADKTNETNETNGTEALLREFAKTRDDDAGDLARVGRAVVIERNLDASQAFWSGCMVVITWPNIYLTAGLSIAQGGIAGLFWSFPVTIVNMWINYRHFAQMAEMLPVAGGQPAFVAVCAPDRLKGVLSWFTGWCCLVTWQGFLLAGSLLLGGLIQAVASLANKELPSWSPPLISAGTILCFAAFNLLSTRWLRYAQWILAVCQIVGAITILIALPAVRATLGLPLASPKDLVNLSSTNPWNSIAIAYIAGLVTFYSSLIAYDAVLHLSEDVKDARQVVPLTLMRAAGWNSVIAVASVSSLIICIPDVEGILATDRGSSGPTGFLLQVCLDSADGNVALPIFIGCILIVILTCCCSMSFCAAQRMLYAFTADKGLPKFDGLGKAPSKSDNLAVGSPASQHDTGRPWQATAVTAAGPFVLACALSWSAVAQQIAISFVVDQMLTTYLMVLCSKFYNDLTRVPFNEDDFRANGTTHRKLVWRIKRHWSLISLPLAIFLLLVGLAAASMPGGPHPGPKTMNWAIVVEGGTILCGAFIYYTSARKTWRGVSRIPAHITHRPRLGTKERAHSQEHICASAIELKDVSKMA